MAVSLGATTPFFNKPTTTCIPHRVVDAMRCDAN